MKNLVIILITLLSVTSFAQDSAKAKALLNEVSQKVKSYDNIAIDFKYVLENANENIKQETRDQFVCTNHCHNT